MREVLENIPSPSKSQECGNKDICSGQPDDEAMATNIPSDRAIYNNEGFSTQNSPIKVHSNRSPLKTPPSRKSNNENKTPEIPRNSFVHGIKISSSSKSSHQSSTYNQGPPVHHSKTPNVKKNLLNTMSSSTPLTNSVRHHQPGQTFGADISHIQENIPTPDKSVSFENAPNSYSQWSEADDEILATQGIPIDFFGASHTVPGDEIGANSEDDLEDDFDSAPASPLLLKSFSSRNGNLENVISRKNISDVESDLDSDYGPPSPSLLKSTISQNSGYQQSKSLISCPDNSDDIGEFSSDSSSSSNRHSRKRGAGAALGENVHCTPEKQMMTSANKTTGMSPALRFLKL